ncbi:hypothetical protein RB195_012179 [Necator americanus]|uniref:Uncharacterized protein n=1 Tax=Necator americanus TaxID=51031 RepID=A0ABR1D621_NECAM
MHENAANLITTERPYPIINYIIDETATRNVATDVALHTDAELVQMRTSETTDSVLAEKLLPQFTREPLTS